jgi:hypothetical protein
MKTVWTAGLTPETSDEMRRDFGASALLRERLQDILTEKIESRRRVTRGPDQYDNAAWGYLQADAIGYERALVEIISLISNHDVTK